MRADQLLPGLHLAGTIVHETPAGEYVETIPVVADARCEQVDGTCQVHVWWTDGTDCYYPPEHDLPVLDSPPVTYIGTRRNHAA